MKKTLFLAGEGKTDIGTAGPSVLPHEASEGVVQIVVRSVLGAPASLEFKARAIKNFPKERGKFKGPKLEGDARNAYRAYQLARHDADGFVMVRDSDGTGTERLEQIKAGIAAAQARPGPNIPVACGLAIETIEAWVIAAAASHDVPAGIVPRGKKPEELWGKADDPSSHHPKSVCTRLLKELDGSHGLAAKVARVAACAASDLEERCPDGFAPFARALRSAFGHWFPPDLDLAARHLPGTTSSM